jgi:hypothetical protein
MIFLGKISVARATNENKNAKNNGKPPRKLPSEFEEAYK